jgi:hypothetical protein
VAEDFGNRIKPRASCYLEPRVARNGAATVSVKFQKDVAAEVFGGPCRGRTYGPLMKSLTEDLPQDTLQDESSAKSEDS